MHVYFFIYYYFQGGAGSVGGWENKTSKKTNTGNNKHIQSYRRFHDVYGLQNTQKNCQRSSHNLSVAELLAHQNIMPLSPAETTSQIQENCKKGEYLFFM